MIGSGSRCSELSHLKPLSGGACAAREPTRYPEEELLETSLRTRCVDTLAALVVPALVYTFLRLRSSRNSCGHLPTIGSIALLAALQSNALPVPRKDRLQKLVFQGSFPIAFFMFSDDFSLFFHDFSMEPGYRDFCHQGRRK